MELPGAQSEAQEARIAFTAKHTLPQSSTNCLSSSCPKLSTYSPPRCDCWDQASITLSWIRIPILRFPTAQQETLFWDPTLCTCTWHCQSDVVSLLRRVLHIISVLICCNISCVWDPSFSLSPGGLTLHLPRAQPSCGSSACLGDPSQISAASCSSLWVALDGLYSLTFHYPQF